MRGSPNGIGMALVSCNHSFCRPEEFTYESMQHLAVNFWMGIRPGSKGVGVVAQRSAWIGYTLRFGV